MPETCNTKKEEGFLTGEEDASKIGANDESQKHQEKGQKEKGEGAKGEEKEEEDEHVLFALHTKGKHFLQELRNSDAAVLRALEEF